MTTFVRFSEESNPSCFSEIRAESISIIRSNFNYEGLSKSKQLDGAVAAGS